MIGGQGPVGKKGSVGDKGPTGDKGEVGDQGAVGKKGPTGDKGPKGPAGDAGTVTIDQNTINIITNQVIANLPHVRFRFQIVDANGSTVIHSSFAEAPLDGKSVLVLQLMPPSNGTATMKVKTSVRQILRSS